ncbi:MAG TPA: SCP2 sterol-binding domain-containing protein [Nannocystis sp.]
MSSDISLDTLTSDIRAKVGDNSGLNATIKFAFEADKGVLYIDGKSTPNTVDNVDREAQCTVKVSYDNFILLTQRKLDPMTAFMTGKLKIEGDMGVAMKLGKLFSGS